MKGARVTGPRLRPTRGGLIYFRPTTDWTLTEAAIRAGMRDEALALLRERLALKPHAR